MDQHYRASSSSSQPAHFDQHLNFVAGPAEDELSALAVGMGVPHQDWPAFAPALPSLQPTRYEQTYEDRTLPPQAAEPYYNGYTHQLGPAPQCAPPQQQYQLDYTAEPRYSTSVSLSYQQQRIAEERAWQEAVNAKAFGVDDAFNPRAPYLFASAGDQHYQPPTYPLYYPASPDLSTSSSSSDLYQTYAEAIPPPLATFQLPNPLHAAPVPPQQYTEQPYYASVVLPQQDSHSSYAPHPHEQVSWLISAESSPSSSTTSWSPPAPPHLPYHPLHNTHTPPSRPLSSNSQPNPTRLSSTGAPSPFHPQPRRPDLSRSQTAPAAPRDDTQLYVELAAARRAQHEARESPLAVGTGRSSIGEGGGGGGGIPGPKAKKNVMEVQSSCWTCGDSIGRFVLRGTEVGQIVSSRSSSSCVACVAAAEAIGEERGKSEGRKGPNDAATYEDTLSAAVDQLRALKVGEEEGKEMSPMPDGPPVVLPSELKKDAMTCDVCSRVVGVGSVSASTSTRPANFTTEIICTRCDSLYKPCSDCGGGGGRLTPGRWRCKELFPGGRKTCLLSHARNPTLDEVSVEVLSLDKIPAQSLDSLEARCRQIFFNTRMGTMCRPEFLSRGDGLATTFEQVEKTTIDSWSMVKGHFREDIEATRGIRRYVGLLFSVPHSRRSKQSRAEAARTEQDKIVTGFFLHELDLANGVAFFSIVAPWATTGVAYDANTLLGEHCTARMQQDLTLLNVGRALEGLPPFPRLRYSFVVAPFKGDSRLTQSLERRGYKPLEELMLLHPEAPRQAFPPEREIFIPRAFVKAWAVHAICIAEPGEEGDLGAPPAKVPRRRPPKPTKQHR